MTDAISNQPANSHFSFDSQESLTIKRKQQDNTNQQNDSGDVLQPLATNNENKTLQDQINNIIALLTQQKHQSNTQVYKHSEKANEKIQQLAEMINDQQQINSAEQKVHSVIYFDKVQQINKQIQTLQQIQSDLQNQHQNQVSSLSNHKAEIANIQVSLQQELQLLQSQVVQQISSNQQQCVQQNNSELIKMNQQVQNQFTQLTQLFNQDVKQLFNTQLTNFKEQNIKQQLQLEQDKQQLQQSLASNQVQLKDNVEKFSNLQNNVQIQVNNFGEKLQENTNKSVQFQMQTDSKFEIVKKNIEDVSDYVTKEQQNNEYKFNNIDNLLNTIKKESVNHTYNVQKLQDLQIIQQKQIEQISLPCQQLSEQINQLNHQYNENNNVVQVQLAGVMDRQNAVESQQIEINQYSQEISNLKVQNETFGEFKENINTAIQQEVLRCLNSEDFITNKQTLVGKKFAQIQQQFNDDLAKVQLQNIQLQEQQQKYIQQLEEKQNVFMIQMQKQVDQVTSNTQEQLQQFNQKQLDFQLISENDIQKSVNLLETKMNQQHQLINQQIESNNVNQQQLVSSIKQELTGAFRDLDNKSAQFIDQQTVNLLNSESKINQIGELLKTTYDNLQNQINTQQQYSLQIGIDTAEQIVKFANQAKQDNSQLNSLKLQYQQQNQQLLQKIDSSAQESRASVLKQLEDNKIQLFNDLKQIYDLKLEQINQILQSVQYQDDQKFETLQNDVKILAQIVTQVEQQSSAFAVDKEAIQQALSKLVDYVDQQLIQYKQLQSQSQKQINNQLQQLQQETGNFAPCLQQEYGKQISQLIQMVNILKQQQQNVMKQITAGQEIQVDDSLSNDQLSVINQFGSIQTQFNQILPLLQISDNNQQNGLFMKLINNLQTQVEQLQQNSTNTQQNDNPANMLLQNQNQLSIYQTEQQQMFDSFCTQTGQQINNLKQQLFQQQEQFYDNLNQVIFQLIQSTEQIVKQILPEQVSTIQEQIIQVHSQINNFTDQIGQQLIQYDEAQQKTIQSISQSVSNELNKEIFGIQVLEPLTKQLTNLQEQFKKYQAPQPITIIEKRITQQGPSEQQVRELENQVYEMQNTLLEVQNETNNKIQEQLEIQKQELESKITSQSNQVLKTANNQYENILNNKQLKQVVFQITESVGQLNNDITKLNNMNVQNTQFINSQIPQILNVVQQFQRQLNQQVVDNEQSSQTTLNIVQQYEREIIQQKDFLQQNQQKLMIQDDVITKFRTQITNMLQLQLQQPLTAFTKQFQEFKNVQNTNITMKLTDASQQIKQTFQNANNENIKVQTQLREQISKLDGDLTNQLNITNNEIQKNSNVFDLFCDSNDKKLLDLKQFTNDQNLLNTQIKDTILQQSQSFTTENTNLKNQITNFQCTNTQLLEELSKKFGATMQSFATDKITQIETIYRNINEQQTSALNQNINQLSTQICTINTQNREIQQDVNECLQQHQKLFSQIQEQFNLNMQNNTESFQKHINNLNGFVQKYEELVKQVKQKVEGEVNEIYKKLHNLLQESINNMENWVGKNVSQITNHLSTYATHYSNLTNNIQQIIMQTDEKIGQMQVVIHKFQHQISICTDQANSRINRLQLQQKNFEDQTDVNCNKLNNFEQQINEVETKCTEALVQNGQLIEADKLKLDQLNKQIQIKVTELYQQFNQLQSFVQSSLNQIFVIKDQDTQISVQQSQIKQKFQQQIQFNGFSDFDNLDLVIQKQTSQLQRELISRNVQTKQFTIFKIKPGYYEIIGRKLYIVENKDGIFIKSGSGLIQYVEYLYDAMINQQ